MVFSKIRGGFFFFTLGLARRLGLKAAVNYIRLDEMS